MKFKIVGEYVPEKILSKNAETAKKGFKAETLFCESVLIKELLEKYFNNTIIDIKKQVHRKKSDVVVVFCDGTTAKIQNKDGTSKNTRGWSVDRRSVDKMPLNDDGKMLLKNVCLKEGTHRPVVEFNPEIISSLLLGDEEEYMPTHYSHTSFDDAGELMLLKINTKEAVIAEFVSCSHPVLEPKRTCVHINKHMYMQRKGGGSCDHSPNDIQLKVKWFPLTTIYDKNQTTPKSE